MVKLYVYVCRLQKCGARTSGDVSLILIRKYTHICNQCLVHIKGWQRPTLRCVFCLDSPCPTVSIVNFWSEFNQDEHSPGCCITKNIPRVTFHVIVTTTLKSVCLPQTHEIYESQTLWVRAVKVLVVNSNLNYYLFAVLSPFTHKPYEYSALHENTQFTL